MNVCGLACRTIVWWATAAVPLWSQAPATEAIALQQALDLAESNNPRLKFAQSYAEGAEAAIVSAQAYPNPEFNTLFGNQYRRQLGAAPGLLQHYSGAQLVELPSVRRTRIQAARQGQKTSEFTLSEARLLLRSSVKQAFFNALRRKTELSLTQESLRLAEDLRRRIQVQVEVGEAARLELTRADAEVAVARTISNSANLRYRNALAVLRTVISAPLPPQFEPQGQIDISPTLPLLDELRTEMLGKHPTLLALRSEVERYRARLESELAQRRPSPILRGEYERQPDLGFFRFGVSVPLPIWNRREGPIGEAAAQLNQSRSALQFRELEMSSALESAYGLYEVARQQVASFEQGVLREAEAAVRAAEAAYKFGERGFIEVLDAQRVLRTVRLDFLNAQYDLQAALIEIEQLRATESNPGGKP
jgi:cobalt-zinc-cadmium efflux system outer membrane protein